MRSVEDAALASRVWCRVPVVERGRVLNLGCQTSFT